MYETIVNHQRKSSRTSDFNLSNLFFVLVGCKMGNNVRINSFRINDPYLLTLEDGVVIGGEAVISCHSYERGVLILATNQACGTSTAQAIQSGLYFGHIGLVKELINRFSTECFNGRKPLIIATGGFARMFEKEKLFDFVEVDLVLIGLKKAHELNKEIK